MYMQASQLRTTPILSLQTGATVAWVIVPIIEITRLEVVAFKCESAETRQRVILMARDIRQLAPDSIIVDSEEELANPDDIVRLKSIMARSYEPMSKHVISDTGRRLGTVDDYTINLATARVQKLHVRQSILKSWLGPGLVIDRTQIIDITPKHITVRDAAIKATLVPSGPVPESPS